MTDLLAEDPRDALIPEQAGQIDQLTVRIALHDELAARQDERIAALTALAGNCGSNWTRPCGPLGELGELLDAAERR